MFKSSWIGVYSSCEFQSEFDIFTHPPRNLISLPDLGSALS